MKKFFILIFLMYVIIMGVVFYFTILPGEIKHFNKIELSNFTLNIPTGFKLIQHKKNFRSYKNMAKITLLVVQKEHFDEKKYFKNYQRNFKLSAGKLYYYLKGKAQYLGIYIQKDDKILCGYLHVSSNLSNWILLFFKIFKYELHMDEQSLNKLYFKIKKNYNMVDSNFLLYIVAGIFLFTILIMYIIFSFSARPPRDLTPYEIEGIIFTKKVMGQIIQTLSHNYTMFFVILTQKYFYVFYFGKEYVKLERNLFENQLMNKYIVIEGKKFKIKFSTKEFKDIFSP